MKNEFSKTISILRKEKGWSQEKLAEQCGVSRQAVAKWESGKCYPDIMRMLDLADLLEVSINDLVPDTKNYRNRYSIIIDTLVSDCLVFFYSNIDTGDIIYTFSENNMSEGEYSDDFHGKLTNTFCEDLTEYHKTIVHPDDYARFSVCASQEFIKKTLDEKERYIYRYRLIVEGKVFYAQTTYMRAKNYMSTHNYVTIIRDITEDMGELLQKQNIIGMISKRYDSTYYVDCDLDLFKRITAADVIKSDTSADVSWFTTLDFGIMYVKKYADNYVLDEYRDEFLRTVNPNYLSEYLQEYESCNYIYKALCNGKISYFRVSATREDARGRRFVVCIENVDSIVESVE